MKATTLIKFALIALVVIICGALAGWFYFLRAQGAATAAINAARGLVAAQTSPFGSGGASAVSTNGSGASVSSPVVPPQLWHVASIPVAGIAFTTSADGVHLRYVERATGYIFDADATTSATARLTNTLMPKIYEALFAGDGHVLERSLDNTGAITTFSGAIAATTSTSTVVGSFEGTFLPTGISAVATDPSSGELFYLQKSAGGVTGVLTLASASTSAAKKTIFSSPLSNWRVYLLPGKRVVIAQSAADSMPGYAYEIKNGVLVSLLRDLPGLTLLPGPSALLYATSQNGTLALFAQNAASTVPLPVRTLADKCAWAPASGNTASSTTGDPIAYCGVPQTIPSGDFLDAWYRGEVHSVDAIWRIDAQTGSATLVYTPSTPVDVLNPVVDGTGTYLAFMNAVDNSPWLLRIK